jgi:hypothetical protein
MSRFFLKEIHPLEIVIFDVDQKWSLLKAYYMNQYHVCFDKWKTNGPTMKTMWMQPGKQVNFKWSIQVEY